MGRCEERRPVEANIRAISSAGASHSDARGLLAVAWCVRPRVVVPTRWTREGRAWAISMMADQGGRWPSCFVTEPLGPCLVAAGGCGRKSREDTVFGARPPSGCRSGYVVGEHR